MINRIDIMVNRTHGGNTLGKNLLPHVRSIMATIHGRYELKRITLLCYDMSDWTLERRRTKD